MIRVINAVLIVLMLVGAGITYKFKHDAEAAANRVVRLNANIAREKEAIALLKAEWSMLSQPGRLQSVTERYKDHFKLEPFLASQVATLDEIPLRPKPAPVAETAKAVAEASAILEAAQ